MSDHIHEHLELRAYLLGKLENLIELESIEEKFLLDKDFQDQLSFQEDVLIEEYVNKLLSESERESFENHFLIDPERRKKLDLFLLLERYNKENSIDSKDGFFQKLWKDLAFIFSKPLPVIITILIALIIPIILISFYYQNGNDSQEVLAELNKAYASERLLESHISDLNYAEFEKSRGDDNSKIDKVAEKRAEMMSLKAASENPTSESKHALARYYLTKRQFDDALEQLKEAQKLSPDNPKIFNDLGIVYFEKSKITTSNTEKLELTTQAIEMFDNALKIDPNLLPSLFNKALAVETYLPNQAEEAWQTYLKFDSTSGWAEEARKKLDRLKNSKSQTFLNGSQLELAFLEAYDQKDEDKAFRIVSENRELIREKYLPIRLTNSFINEQDSGKKLDSLEFLGDIEQKKIKDRFASDLADYYKGSYRSSYELLKEAKSYVKIGIELCLKDDYNNALKQFRNAQKLFLKAGNEIEAKTLCLHFIAYCLFNLNQRKEAYQLFKEVDDYCKKKNYVWFQTMNLDWFMTNEELFEQKTFTETKKSYEEALKKAEDIQDHYMIQKFLLALVRKSNFLKRISETHNYIHQLLRFSNQPNVSERQKFRNYYEVISILSQDDLHSLAREISLEGIALAEPMGNSPFLVSSRINAGMVYLKTGDFKMAEYWLDEAKKQSENLEGNIKNNFLAEVFLQLGHLESKRNQFQKAVAFYDRAIEILSNLQLPVLYYEAKKSRLMAYQKNGDRQKVEEDIYSTIEIAETYRKKISEEQDRNSFFDNEQTIYDIAIDHKTSSGQNEEAYNYSETSKARTLLDKLTGGANILSKDNKTEIIIPEPVNPLKLTDLRKKIPTNVQLLQYSVLEDKVIIWIVTKERFLSVSKSTSSDELKENIYEYLKLVKQKEPAEKEAKTLFNKLIEPALPYLDEKKEICLIPDKFLFQLPFISLMSSDGKYLLEEFDLFYSPSANVFAYSTEMAKNKSRLKNEKFLGIGNPSFDLQKFSDLKYLPEAEKEVREISKKYSDSKLLIADEATKKAFYDLYENYEIIHFAGHYIAQPESPLSSKLLMAKNSGKIGADFINNAELMRKKLPQTKLIILSACQTGIENYSNSEGLIGLSRTFLTSQVPLVIGSQWKVDSEVTAEIMQMFHNFRQQEKLSSNKALKQSQLAYLRSNKGKFKLPYYWAAFATFGGYADF